MKINAYDIWRINTAINMHFMSGYDAFRFNFKAKHLNPFNFDRRRDKYHFVKMEGKFADQQHVIDYIFANRIYGDNTWIGEMNDGPYQIYQKNLQLLSYKFKMDLQQFDNKRLDDILFTDPNTIPPLVERYLSDQVMMETVVIIDILTNFLTHIPMKEDMFWPIVQKELLSCKPFINSKVKNPKRFKVTLIDRESQINVYKPDNLCYK
jgi:hypothetical protein